MNLYPRIKGDSEFWLINSEFCIIIAKEPATINYKILTIEDDKGIGDTISLIFELRWPGTTVLRAENGKTGLEFMKAEKPDLVLLDLGLPDTDGLDLLRQIRLFSQVPIIIVTVRDREFDRVKGLVLGADDYVVKPFSHLELLARAWAVMRRTRQDVPEEGKSFISGDLEVDFTRREVRLQGKPVKLTPTEYSLLSHLVRNEGKVLTHQALLEKVWGEDFIDSREYLKVYIQRLRDKLKSKADSPDRIVTERGIGYRFVRGQ